jgi:aryl-alcohol dehydrogenase-like predicted oxidoreductase
MWMSDLYGPADETESIATIHAALDAGITLLERATTTVMGHNELLDLAWHREPHPADIGSSTSVSPHTASSRR